MAIARLSGSVGTNAWRSFYFRDNLPARTRHAQVLQGLPQTFSRAPMPQASSAQAAAIAKALEGLGVHAGQRVEAAE